MWWSLFVEVIYFPSRSLRKSPTFRDPTAGISVKWRLRQERRNSILTTQIWLVLLIGWTKFPRGRTNRKHDPDLGSDTSSVWNFSAVVSQIYVISRGNRWWLHEMSAVFPSYADRKPMKRRLNTNYTFFGELTESIFPVLFTARLRSQAWLRQQDTVMERRLGRG